MRAWGISHAAYYKWLHRKTPESELENQHIADDIEKIHKDSPDKGYRRIGDDLERYHGMKAHDKRILRICRKLGIKSTIKYANNGCTRQAKNPQYIAENILDRQFSAQAPNEKWLTDVTEFHYYVGLEKHKVYLSAILDLYDRRIVSSVIGDLTIMSWYFVLLMKLSRQIQMHIRFFIVTGVFNTQIGRFIKNWRVRG